VSATLILFLYVVSILVIVLIHEAAHFAAAKRFGIRVEEFFVGFGPRLWSFRRGETEYGIKALPLGGYVRIAGMNPFQEPSPEELPRTFGAKPIWQRSLVIFAGPATHFVLAFVVVAVYLGAIGQPTEFAPVIGSVESRLNGEPSPAALAGLEPGDEILAVDELENPSDQELVAYTREHVGEEITLLVRRGEEEFTVAVTPVLSDFEGEQVGRIGVSVASGRILARDRLSPADAVIEGGALVGRSTWLVIQQLGNVFDVGRIVELLFGGAERQPDDVTSVVGGGRIAVQAAQAGAVDALFNIFFIFNIFIGLLNLVPIPPFDGGHLAVLAIEKVTGRKVDARRMVPITAFVATFLILFMVSLIYLDITKPVPNLFR
jgi:membrane-associated protease RseP (regulator of RpoE activity)